MFSALTEVDMTQRIQKFTKRYVNVLGVLMGLAVVSSILFYSGCGMTSSPNIRTNPTPTPDRSAPTSVIGGPTAGATVLTIVGTSINGTASDTGGGTVIRVEVSVDGGATYSDAALVHMDGRPPGVLDWSFRWTPATPGPVTIKSRAVDNSLNVQDPPAQVAVTVIQDTTPPTTTITSPQEGDILPQSLQIISGTASDAGGGRIVRIEVSTNGGANYSNVINPGEQWAFRWLAPQPGPVTIKSRAVDDSGNVQDPPTEIHVTVGVPPTSTITSPTAGEVISTTTTVSITGTARAADVATLARVEVSVDGGATYSPAMGTTAWRFNWTPATPGPATIKSRAVDDRGNKQDPPAEVTVTVPIRVPSDQPTIQAAIDVANNGDTALVAPGTYSENINFKGKAITVTSESGPKVTIIDGGNVAPVVSFISGEGRDSVINGFTLQNGRADFTNQGTAEGGGVKVMRSSPKITNNVITNNHACAGGGIGSHSGSPLIQMNTITSNNATNICPGGFGGGISIQGSSSIDSRVEILDNVISDNVSSVKGGGIYMFGATIAKRNIIKGNKVELEGEEGQGGGIWTNDVYALIVQNFITGNHASIGGGIYWFASQGLVGPIVINNTLADNDAPLMGSGIFANGFDDQAELTNNIIVAKPGQAGLHCGDSDGNIDPIIRFNNIYSAGGTAYGGTCSDKTGMVGNISDDPLFIDPAQGDYHLQQGSPSIDKGDNQAPNLPDTDIDGNPRILDGDGNGTATIDMGVDEFLLPPGLKISLLDERNRNSTNGRNPFICDLRSWTRTLSRRPKNPLSAPPQRSPRLRVE